MTLLLEQIKDLEEQLNVLVSGSENREAVDDYVRILQKINPLVAKFTETVSQRSVLMRLPNDNFTSDFLPSELEKISNVRVNTNLFDENFKEKDHKISQGDDLSNLCDSISGFIVILSSNNEQSWSSWIQSLASSIDISESLLREQENIPHLIEICEQYRNKMTSFNVLIVKIPSDEKTIFAISELVDELKELIRKMDFELPEEVKVFFKLIQSYIDRNEVPLSMLSNEVLQWLRERGELDRFVVKRKGIY